MEESGLSGLGEAVCDHQVGENGLSDRFDIEISPMHRSTSTVGYSVFRRWLGVVSSLTCVVGVCTTTTCTPGATVGPSR